MTTLPHTPARIDRPQKWQTMTPQPPIIWCNNSPAFTQNLLLLSSAPRAPTQKTEPLQSNQSPQQPMMLTGCCPANNHCCFLIAPHSATMSGMPFIMTIWGLSWNSIQNSSWWQQQCMTTITSKIRMNHPSARFDHLQNRQATTPQLPLIWHQQGPTFTQNLLLLRIA